MLRTLLSACLVTKSKLIRFGKNVLGNSDKICEIGISSNYKKFEKSFHVSKSDTNYLILGTKKIFIGLK